MKMRGKHEAVTAALLAALVLLAGCAEQQTAPPAKPAPRPAPHVVVPPPPPPAPPPPADWQDLPLTPGDWRYAAESGGSVAEFGPAGAPTLFGLRCEAASRQIRVTGLSPAGALVIRTSFGARSLPGRSIAASDPLLDQIAFSRGRFTVEAEGRPSLVIPAWPEPARVIEDCRG